MSHHTDEIINSKFDPSPQVLRHCICLCFDSFFAHQKETFRNHVLKKSVLSAMHITWY